MRLVFRYCLVLILVLAISLSSLGQVHAARGVPGSMEFGIGTAYYPGGPHQEEALKMAAELDPDWIYVPISWSAYQASAKDAPDFEALDAIFRVAKQNRIAVAVSLTGTPIWAQTSQGPDAALVSQFLTALSQRYPKTLQAVELFPRANTKAGWGSPANPQAYFDLYRQVDARLRKDGSEIFLIAAGLQPLSASPGEGDMDDLAFLKALYASGASDLMPVISLQYMTVTGDPLDFPDGSSQPVLRHYEIVGKIMVENHHQNGIIWITRIPSASSKIGVSSFEMADYEMQVNWVTQVYVQMRSQLYLGVTIGQSLNPEREGAADVVLSLLQGAGMVHPFYSVLNEMISLNKMGSSTIKPGRPKEGNFSKMRP